MTTRRGARPRTYCKQQARAPWTPSPRRGSLDWSRPKGRRGGAFSRLEVLLHVPVLAGAMPSWVWRGADCTWWPPADVWWAWCLRTPWPERQSQLLCGAKLAALPKQDGGGLRPIAVGETLRRVVSKAAAARLGPQLREALEPVQLGVGRRTGARSYRTPSRPGSTSKMSSSCTRKPRPS